MKILLRAAILSCVVLLSSCCSERACDPGSLNSVLLVSFSPQDRDTVVFRKFKAGSNFLTIKDSLYVDIINHLYSYTTGDSTYLSFDNAALFKIEPGYDYQIFIPGTGKLTSISNIIEEKTKHTVCVVADGPQECSNPITSFQVDGQTQTGIYIVIRK